MRLHHLPYCALLAAPLVLPQITLISRAAAAVYSQQQALSAQTIQEFLANPAALLAQYSNGGAELIGRVRDLAASDPATLNPLIDLLATANSNQSTAIGSGLAQVALMAVKTDPAYANQIQEAIASADKGHGEPTQSGGASTVAASTQPKIGNAVTINDQVEGITENGVQPIVAGSDVYSNELVRTGDTGKAELLFADHTNLTIGPVTEIRLDKFVYDPSSGSGTVVFNAPRGAFRFITGLQPHQDYAVKTPYATMGVRGTVFYVVITPNSEQVQLGSGEVIVTTISGKVVTMGVPGSILWIDSYGNTQSQTPTNQPIVNFADLGPPTTSTSFADARAAFDAVTADAAIGAAGAGGLGGGGGGTGSPGGAGGGGGGTPTGTPNLTTFALTPPGSSSTATQELSSSVSP